MQKRLKSLKKLFIDLIMILSVHQPHFFPWLGYFDKMIKSDKFVYLDNVQYRKNYFQNRTQVKIGDTVQWLTLTINKAPLSSNICQIEIAENFNLKDVFEKLNRGYSKSINWDLYSEDVRNIINLKPSLSALNIQSIEFLLSFFSKSPIRYISSELNTNELDANLRLIRICQELNCDVYLSGIGGKKYMDLELFKKEGIEVIFQDFSPEQVFYNQLGNSFVHGLSALDYIFNNQPIDFEALLIGNIKL
jgi:hypothetical protein